MMLPRLLAFWCSALLALLLQCSCRLSCDACLFTDQESYKSANGALHLLQPCNQVCRLDFKASCQCYVLRKDLLSVSIRLECSQTNASILMRDIDSLSSCNLNLVELHVTNSNLTRLYHLPSGLYNVQEMVLENTGIDLETIRESNELLRSLKILRISQENYTEIPETLFHAMDELQELSLNNLGLAYISSDSFVSLQDSLKHLELRDNRLRTIPNAVQMLSHLECLDLSANDIKTISDGNTVIFSTGLKRLKRLRISLSKCSCDFGKSKFATWLRTYAIKGVTCNASGWPERRLLERDVSNTPVEEFCEAPANSGNPIGRLPPLQYTFNWLLLLVMLTIGHHFLGRAR